MRPCSKVKAQQDHFASLQDKGVKDTDLERGWEQQARLFEGAPGTA